MSVQFTQGPPINTMLCEVCDKELNNYDLAASNGRPICEICIDTIDKDSKETKIEISDEVDYPRCVRDYFIH